MQRFPHDVTVNQLPGRDAFPYYILLSREVLVSLLCDYLWYGSLGDNFGCFKHSSACLDCLGCVVHQEVFQGGLPDSGGPMKMDVISTDTEPCFLRDSWYANCHSKKTRSRGLCVTTSKGCSSCGESWLAQNGLQTCIH